MFRWIRSRRKTRVWLAVEALSDGTLSIDRAAADLAAAIGAIENRGGIVQTITAAPVQIPNGTAVLMVVVWTA